MFSIPKSYDELKLGNYLAFIRAQAKDPTELSAAFAALLGTTYAEFVNYPDYLAIETGLAFLNNEIKTDKDEKNLPKLNFSHAGKDYLFVPHLMHLSFGQMIDFDKKLKAGVDNPDHNIDLVLGAMLCLDGVEGYKETRTLISIEQARQIVCEMPTQQAYELWLFFCSKTISFQSGSDISMVQQAKELLNLMPKNWITTNGTDGANSWTSYVKAQYLNTMKFLVYLAETYSAGVIGGWRKQILTRLRPHLSQSSYNNLNKTLSAIVPDKNIPSFQAEYNKFLILHI